MIFIILKFVLILIIVIITCIFLNITHYINTDYEKIILEKGIDNILKLFNINIVHLDISKLPKKSNIIVYNHIHLLDTLVLCKVQQELPTFLISKNFNFFPINLITKLTNSLEVNFKSNNTVSKIKDKLNKPYSSNIYIAPGKCDVYQEGEYLSNFKTGAFRLQTPITPLIIKYYNSNSEPLNWKDDESLIELVIRTLTNKRIDLYIEVMDTIIPTDSDSVEQFRDKVYIIMQTRLKELC